MTYPTQKGERCQRCQGTGFVPGDPEGAPTEGCDDCRGTGIQKGEREEALLPCPFCGGDAEIVHIEEGENAGGSCVCCKRCNASSNVEFEFKENFISNWNRRSSSKAEGEMREALRRVDHTLSVHGHVDADTDLHAFIRAALSKEGA